MTRCLALIVLIALVAPATSAGALCGPASTETRNGGISAVPALRLFDGDAEQLPCVGEFYRTHIKPEHDARGADGTAKKYKTSIKQFLAFLDNAGRTSSSPGNLQYDDLTLLKWQQWLQQEGKKNSTINGYWRCLKAVFNRMKDVGVIERVPKLKRLPEPRPKPVVIPMDTIDAVYRYGCPDMTWPDPLPAASTCELWRALLVCEWNFAMRIGDVRRMEWSWIHWEPQSLDPASDNESPHGWVEWVTEKTEANIILPLHAAVRQHLESIFDAGQRYVFGREMKEANDDRFYGREARPGQWHQLIEMTRAYKSVRSFTPKDLRSTANTQYNRLDRKLGAVVLGHTPQGVNDTFYQSWEADMIRFVGEYPQPPSFTRRLSPPVRQERLF